MNTEITIEILDAQLAAGTAVCDECGCKIHTAVQAVLNDGRVTCAECHADDSSHGRMSDSLYAFLYN